MIQLFGADHHLNALRDMIVDKDKTIERLRDRITELEDEHFKDVRLKEMSENLQKMQEAYYRGYPISKDEKHEIANWMKRHDEETHKKASSGTIGGRYTYCFTPTSIGEVGIVRCSCGAEFTFRELT